MGRVKVNPKMLKWARVNSGYNHSNLPKRFQDKYEKWESGEKLPTWKQLQDISNTYKWPSALFFRKNPPKSVIDSIELIEFRKFNPNMEESNSPKFNIGLRKAINKRNSFLELIEDMNYPIPSFSRYQLDTKNVNELSSNIKKYLNVSLDEQKNWIYRNNSKTKDFEHYNFLNQWKEKISELGVLIFEIPEVELYEMRALCIYYEKFPIILLNGKDSVNARIFSLIHELTHLILGESAICDLKSSEETLCNSVAGEILVPKKDLLKNNLLDNHDSYWEDSDLKKLSDIYGVSKEVILLRLLSLNKTTQEVYELKKEEWSNLPLKKKESGGGDPVRTQVKYNGKLYSRVFLSAYQNNLIDGIELYENLNIKLKHLDYLNDYLFE